MSQRLRGSLGRRWNPERLGESIPIARGLGISRILGALLGLAILAVLAWQADSLYEPEGVPTVSGNTPREVVLAALQDVRLPAWDSLGGTLSGGDRPSRMPTPVAPLWTAPDPSGSSSGSEDIAQAMGALQDGNGQDAAFYFDRAADSSGLWAPRYNHGIALAKLGLAPRAVTALEQARDRLDSSRYRNPRDRPAYIAAWIVTRYALAEVRLNHEPDKCLEPIQDLKQAVGKLDDFVAAGGARTVGRELPFRLAPTELNSYDVWLRLNELYHQCEGYPVDYFRRGFGTTRYRQQRTANPDLVQNRDGLFPDRAQQCWNGDGDQHRDCWWRLNYNHLFKQSERLVSELNSGFASNWPALARLYQHLAVALAEDDGRFDTAGEVLAGARKLAQAAAFDPSEKASWLANLETLGRYLAGSANGTNGQHAPLAEPYRGLAIEELDLAGASDWQLKGMTQALTERWQGQIANGDPDAMAREIAEARDLIAPHYFDSLESWWTGEAQPVMRARLKAAIREERPRSIERAKAIRDFRADYLGGGWGTEASLVWFEPHWLELSGILLAGLLLLALWWLVHRFAVYPYLMYSRNYYQTEFQRRHKERMKVGKPFTAPELEEQQRRLRNARRGR